ncbi:MAG: response regulator [Candidatus Didemnitutus sp.]|nr:response regulator [Candidatus Didemnitutus sp.]
MSKVTSTTLLRNLHLLPFLALAFLGGLVLLGWWTGQVNWVQPRAYDLPLPANAAFCFFALGLSPFLFAVLPGRRLSALPALVATLLALLALASSGLRWWPEVDNLLTHHDQLIEGNNIGRVPLFLGVILVATGALLAWLGTVRIDPRRPLLLALVGSLAGAYGFTAVLAGRIGLTQIDLWSTHAHIGPQAALALQLLGAALVLLAARDAADTTDEAGPRWLWLPVVTASATITILFWVSLRGQQTAYLNTTTNLTINTVASAFKAETEAQINNLRRMAERWTDSGGTPLASWEKDARAHAADFPAYRSISWVDANFRTRWFWPREGNEDAASFDHRRDPLRLQALTSARETLAFAIAAPIVSPVQPPSLAVYATVLSGGTFDGFIVGELGLPKVFDAIDDRLNISSRYEFTARFLNPQAAQPTARDVIVFQSAEHVATPNERLRQSATFNLLGQRVVLELLPRPEFIAPNRQYLPEVALASGLGVSLLLGLVVNLAQSARNRQRAAESTSEQLRAENEERRRIEARLKVTDERLNLALDATHIGVIEWNLNDGRAIYSAGFWNSLGYDAGFMPAIHESLLRLVHPDDLKGYHAALDAHLTGKAELFESEFRVKHQNGNWEWFVLRAKCVGTDRIGRPLRIAGTCQNITSRKSQQEALRASQAATRKLSLVASRTDNAVVITRSDGRVEWVNESFSRLAEHTLEDIGGRPFVELLSSPEDDLTAVERVTRAFARREAITTDVIHHARSGKRYHVHLELQPVLNDEGAVENFIVIETDITSRVEVEQQLRRAKAEADSASRAKSEFLASMSHEIRTPMNGVIGMTSLLMETTLTPEQRDYVQTIRTSGDALLSIINEILDFSKIESGRMELERHPFELSQCVEETLDIFALQAAAKGIELAYAIDPAVPTWIVGDITRLRQVLVNLVNNAVKFTPSGFITIEVKLAAEAGTPGDGALLLDFIVTDTGIGIPADRQSALFKPFSQVDSSTTRKYGGTGLGLAICDRLVQLMGGTVDVTSQLGHGSRFRFNIQTERAEVPTGGRVLNFAGVAVLAVDDHAVNRHALGTCLHQWGCTPVLAENAAQALAAAADRRPAIAIVDHDLAGTAGDELVKQLHALQPGLPIVLLTAASDGVRQGQSAEPFIMRLPKPIKPTFLGECLSRLMKGGALAPPPTPTAVAPHSELARSIPLDILLVEDNPVNQKVALHLLNRLGYQSDAVSNGLEAIRAIEQRDYDLVFMDVQMPEMDGLTATREIRNRLPKPRQPIVVALTANAVQGDRERCLAAGMDDYLPKPVKLDDLHAMVRKYFAEKT